MVWSGETDDRGSSAMRKINADHPRFFDLWCFRW